MKKVSKAFMAVVTLLFTESILSACHSHFRDHMTPEKVAEKLQNHVDRGLKKVGTTDEQNEKIHLITSQIADDAIQTHKSCSAGKSRLIANLLSETPNREELHQRVDEKAKATTEFVHRVMARMLEINAVLSRDQRYELMKRYESKHGSKE